MMQGCRPIGLGWDEIDAIFVTGNEIEREGQEIAENLHRAELTALERSNQIARWAELTAAKTGQVDQPFGRRSAGGEGCQQSRRAYAIQVETLRRLRGGGSQYMRVEHIHLEPNSQAIIGNFQKKRTNDE